MPELANYGSIPILEAALAPYVDESNRHHVLEVLTAPEQPSFYQTEEMELYETNDLLAHQRRYFWLKNSYSSVEIADLAFFEERKRETHDSPRREFENKQRQARERKKIAIEQYHLPSSVVDIAEAIVAAIEWQDDRKKHIWIYLHYKNILLNDLCRRTGKKKDVLLNFRELELERLLSGDFDFDSRGYRESGAFGFLCADGKVQELSRENAEIYWDAYSREKVKENTSSFSGTLVSKGSGGKQSGRVQIILDPKKATHFTEGNILVAPMTTPEYVFLMKNAAAIITDTGGLTSHAAIVSRELHKACIVGTKIATQVLHDGDLVEVDAETSVVRVLERAGNAMGDLCDEYLKLIGKRKLYPPLNGYSVFLQGSEYNIQKYYKKWYDDTVKPDLFIHIKEGYSQVWLPEDDLKTASEFGFREYLHDPAFFERRGAYMAESIEKIDKLYREYTYEKVNDTDWEKLFTLVNEVRDIMWDVNAAVIFSIYLDQELCIQVLEKENYALSSEKLKTLWEKAIEPAFESFDKAQLNHFLALVKESTPREGVTEQCQYFLTDYHSTRTLPEVEKILNERYAGIHSPDAAAHALQSETEEINGRISAHEAWLKSLPEHERRIAYYLQTVMKIRDRRKNFFAKGMTILYRIAERMFTEAKVERTIIPYYTVHELLKSTEYLRVFAESLLDRKNGFQWLVPYEGEVRGMNISIDSGVEKINAYFRNCHSSKEEMSDTLKGQPGCKGVVIGRVRVVINVNSDHGFTDGEILVAGMTRPEYVPLMKKASAIITDEGGITCHAAIVSRELKKPCIIGTKIATQVLHDGDLVEVDADNGVVRILEKSKK